MSLIFTIEFDAADGERDALVDKLLSVLHETRAFDGCEQINFTESTSQPGTLLLIEKWASNEHYDAYKTWRRETGTSVLSSDLVAGAPRTTTFTVLDG